MEITGKKGGDEMLIGLGQNIEIIADLPAFSLEALHHEDYLLKDFDIPMLNNLFATIGWRTFNYRKEHGNTELINPAWFASEVSKTLHVTQ